MKLPPILFFGGKGGVGKTTLAAATAAGLASSGHRTLLVSTDPAHSISDLLDVQLGDVPLELAPGLWVRELDPERARDAYLAGVKDNIRRFAAPEFLHEAERQVDLSGQHPGVMESAIFEALCRQLDETGKWDSIVIDTAPTGHTLYLLTLPESMQAWTHALLERQSQAPGRAAAPEGEIRWRQAREVLEARRALFVRTRDKLQDRATTAFILVVNDDRLSVRESRRAREALDQAGVYIAAVLVNRVKRSTDHAVQDLEKEFPQLTLRAIADQDPSPQGLAGLGGIIAILRQEGFIPS